MNDSVMAYAPRNNGWGLTVQPEEFRKTGIVYVISDEICSVGNCGMFTYNATYQSRVWEACYYCKVKRYLIEQQDDGTLVWSGYSVMI